MVKSNWKTTILLVGLFCQVFSFTNKMKYMAIVSVPSCDLPGYWSTPYHYNMIPDSYVQWLIQGGIIPILLPYDTDEKLFRYVLDHTQGVLLPGGDTGLFSKSGYPGHYMRAVNFVMDYAKSRNDSGKKFLVWGTGLGYRAMMMSLSGMDRELLKDGFDDSKTMNKISTTSLFQNSKLWKDLDTKLVQDVFGKEKIYFSHHLGYDPEEVKNHAVLGKDINILGTSVSKNGKEFVSIVEHKSYPFYGVEWNPEKTQYEKLSYYGFLDRSQDTMHLMREIVWRIAENMDFGDQLTSINWRVRPMIYCYQESKKYATEEYSLIYLYRNSKYNYIYKSG